jgi:hypothetical protein
LLEDARTNDFTHALAYALATTPRERNAPWFSPDSPGVMMLVRRP